MIITNQIYLLWCHHALSDRNGECMGYTFDKNIADKWVAKSKYTNQYWYEIVKEITE